MSRIFRAEDVTKIAEAVMIPDCVVRTEPHSFPESTIIEEPVPEEIVLEEFSEEISEEEEPVPDETVSELYESELEKLQIEREAIIKQAQTEAAQIIEAARAESQQMIDDAAEQSRAVMAAALEDGYRDGVRAKQEEIDACMLKMNQYLSELKIEQEEYFDEYASELKFTALEIAEKIVAQKLETDENVIIPLVRSAVKTLREVNWIKVEVSDKLKNAAAELETVLSEAKSSQSIEVELRRDADAGTCVVHTAEGVIVASVLQQIENIREYFGQYKESDENAQEPRSF